MGYYTRYELTVSSNADTDAYEGQDVIETFREECEEAMRALDVGGVSLDDTKWYSHEKDLRKFSLNFPDVVFTLEGEGEESGDIWKKYFQDGLMQKCEAIISFDKFNKLKLK